MSRHLEVFRFSNGIATQFVQIIKAMKGYGKATNMRTKVGGLEERGQRKLGCLRVGYVKVS